MASEPIIQFLRQGREQHGVTATPVRRFNVTFADGVYELPLWAAKVLGGDDAIEAMIADEERRAALAAMSYADFIAALERHTEANALNRIQGKIINAALTSRLGR